MRKILAGALLGTATFACWVCSPSAAQAQFFSSSEIQRGLSPGVYVPYGGAPLTQRYAYRTGAFLYFGGNAQQLYLMDYLDRYNRAMRFGYPEPPDPFHRTPEQYYQPTPPGANRAVTPAIYYYRH